MGAPLRNRTKFVLAATALVAAAAGVSARQLLASRAGSTRNATAPPKSAAGAAAGAELVLHVPHTPGAITLDGDADDPGWTGQPTPARTHEFLLPSGAPARPFSEIRLVWGDGYLYLCLYAADEDIESRTTEPDGPLWLDDAFRVVFARDTTEYAIEVSPRAVITDSIRHAGGGGGGAGGPGGARAGAESGGWDYAWSSGAHVSKEMDGTLNDPTNMDEEWVIEMAVPFESLGLEGRPGETLGFSASRCDTPKGAQRVCASWGQGAERGRIVLD